MTDLPPGFVVEGRGAAPTIPMKGAQLPPGFEVEKPPRIERAGVWPFNKNPDTGEVSFDPHAGVLGSIISGVTAPGDVASGQLNPDSPEAIQRAMDFTGIVSPVAAGSKAAGTIMPGVTKALRQKELTPPTADALYQSADSAYDAARGMGVDYSSGAVKSWADGIKGQLEADGVFAELSPKTFSILAKLQEPPAGSVASLDNLIAARRALGNAAGDFTNPTEKMAAARAIESLDTLLQGSDPASVVAGPAAAAGKVLEDARGNYAAAKRSDQVTGVEERALDRAGATNSGLNIDNQIRQRIESIINKPKDARGYSPEEIAFMREVVRGTHGSNAARYVGNLLGGGGGLGGMLTGLLTGTAAGSAGGSPGIGAVVGTALPGIGYLSKKLSGSMARAQLMKLDKMVRERSPMHQQNQAAAPMQEYLMMNPAARAAFQRALLLGLPDKTTPNATPEQAAEYFGRAGGVI
jgi:hypothetical protein